MKLKKGRKQVYLLNYHFV